MRRQHRPRYQGIAKIKLLENNLSQMDSVVAQLKKEKDSAKKNIENLRKSIQSACSTIKVCGRKRKQYLTNISLTILHIN